MNEKHIFFMAGEKSGDLHGTLLLEELQGLIPHGRFTGVGGPSLRAQGLSAIARSEDFEVMGFTAVIARLGKLIGQFLKVKRTILSTYPDAVVFIDYPGFNLRMAKALRKAGYQGKIIQYISPTFWAWGKGRVEKMEKSLDLLMTIYPFEEQLLSASPLKTKYVGNPTWEEIDSYPYQEEWTRVLGIKRTHALISIFPGSRKSEIENNFPDILQAAIALKTENPEYIFGVSCANVDAMAFISQHIQRSPLRLHRDIFLIPQNYRYELMRDSRTAIAKCGTVTLELALHQRPTVVVYKVPFLNRMIAKYLIKLKMEHFAMPNILEGSEVFPELIKENYTPQALKEAFLKLDTDSTAREQCVQKCAEVKKKLSGTVASKQAALSIMELLGR